MDIPTYDRPLLKRSTIRSATWILILVLPIICLLTVRACTDAPGATTPPAASRLGKPESPDPGGIDQPKKIQQHNVCFSDRDAHKLIPKGRHTRTHQTKFGYQYIVVAVLNIIYIIAHYPDNSNQTIFGVRYRHTHTRPDLELIPSWDYNLILRRSSTNVLGVCSHTMNRSVLILVKAII